MIICVGYLLFLLFPLTASQPKSEKLGPIDVLIMFDESKNMGDMATKKYYNVMMNFIFEHFNVGLNDTQTRVAVLCTGLKWNLTYLSQSDSLNKIQFCNGGNNGAFKENLHENFEAAVNLLFFNGSRSQVQKIVFVFTNGIVTPSESVFPAEAKRLREEAKIIFFYLLDPNDSRLNKEAMVNITQDENSVIYFDQQNLKNTYDNFLTSVCKFGTCKAVPEHHKMKCQRNTTGTLDSCFHTSQIQCEENECECDEMYPWVRKQCPVTCGGGEQILERSVLPGSNCDTNKTEICGTHSCPLNVIPNNGIRVKFIIGYPLFIIGYLIFLWWH